MPIRTHQEVESRSVTNEDFLEILSDGSPGSMDVFAIAQCDYFIGASSGPIWVALLFDFSTLQLNYSDPLLNGPFLANHFAAPINIFEKIAMKSYRLKIISNKACRNMRSAILLCRVNMI